MINVYNLWHPGIDFNSLEGNACCNERQKKKKMLFHFPKDRGGFAPMPDTSRTTAWISYSAKARPAKAGNGPAKPGFTSSVTDTHACICHALAFLLVFFAWLLTTAAFRAASNFNNQRHKPLLALMLLDVNITNET